MTTPGATEAIMQTYVRWPVEFVRGSGAHLFDADGRRYIDMTAGIAVASVGHAHPRVASAIAQQASELIHVSNLYRTQPQERLATRLGALTGGMQTFFCNSGAESIECALKLARRHAGRSRRHKVIAAEKSFHGRTFGALAATGQPSKQEPFDPMLPGFVHVPFGDAHALEEAFDGSTIGVLLEPIQGEGGVVSAPSGYLASARRLCDEHGALLILDEVQTGMGRTGVWFAHELFDVRPDIMCLAKGLAGGLPIGACLATPEVAGAFRAGDHASTFGGGPVQCSAALAVMDVIEDEGLLARTAVRGKQLADGLAGIFGGSAVRGVGLMLAVGLHAPVARKLCTAALEHGLLVNDVAADALRFTPPLVITQSDVDDALNILQEVANEVQAA